MKAACDAGRKTSGSAPPIHGSGQKRAAGLFKQSTSNGPNSWTLHDLSGICDDDMDRLAALNTDWLRAIVFPLQDIGSSQTGIPEANGGFRMVCAQGSNWRMLCKMESAQEGAFNSSRILVSTSST